MVKKSVAAFVFLLFCGYCIAQSNASKNKALADAAWARAGCGADSARFNVKLDKPQRPTPQPEAGQAMVYVFEDDFSRTGFPTTRVGLDGKWVGGNVPGSYLFFSIQPGTHRLCSNWQGTSNIGVRLISPPRPEKSIIFIRLSQLAVTHSSSRWKTRKANF